MINVLSKRPELILFDADGVLIDSEILRCEALVEMLSDYGIKSNTQEALELCIGRRTVDVKEDIEARYNLTLDDDFFAKRREKMKEIYEKKLSAIEGIHDLVQGLEIKKCVASGSPVRWLEYALGKVGLWDFFAPNVFSAEQVERGKPAPDVFLFAAKQMGIAPSECLVIEDGVAGIQAAKEAGMKSFGYAGGSHCNKEHAEILKREGALHVFTDMSEIAKDLAA